MRRLIQTMLWVGVALAGAGAYGAIALRRGEPLSSAYVVVAALCTYALAYRFYAKWIAARVLALDARRATPCEVRDDGHDYVRTNRWIVFGHHFAAISGPGPLVGPVLAAQFGYLPGTLWLLIGAVLGGAVQDFVILFCSLRRNGRSLAQMVRDEIHTLAGRMGAVAILSILVVLLAVLALVVVKVLAESPWGVFTVGATIPIAMLMGTCLRFWRVGRVLEVSVLGVILLLLAVWGGRWVQGSPTWSAWFTLRAEPIAWFIIVYGLAASILPVWLLLAPRDYLSTFMKLGTILALALGVLVVLPDLRMPALTRFTDGSGPVVPGQLFPFCFITIACGAISGFHSLVASGVTPKILTREHYARPVGYGAMCLESLVAIMAMIAACTLEPGVYFSVNVDAADPDPALREAAIVAKVRAAGFETDPADMHRLAASVKETSLFGRTGGAATLAVGMANIFSRLTAGRWMDLWYHFAIMFEALFILTTLDAGTRVGRYLLQDALGGLWRPLGETRRLGPNLLASGLMVAGWGFFLVLGVRDPDGGVKALWPLFGIANQMLAAIALCLGTTVLLKMHLQPGRPARPAFALVTLIPLAWLLAVTLTAGAEKILHPDPRIGFHRGLQLCTARIEEATQAARVAPAGSAARAAAEKTLRTQRQTRFNLGVDTGAVAVYLVMLVGFVGLSVREWVRLLRRRRQAVLSETPPVWLPDYAVVENRPWRWASLVALALGLARELSGQAEFEAARTPTCVHGPSPETPQPPASGAAYGRWLETRYRDVRRCC